MSGNDMYNIPLSSDSESDGVRPVSSVGVAKQSQQPPINHSRTDDQDRNPEEEEEKNRLITQILELQNTLDDLSQKVDSVKEENLKLRSENQVLGQYIENLLAASTVFQPTSTASRAKKKSSGNKKK